MTQIKKFAWGSVAVGLAMVVAMSMVVSTAHAAADTAVTFPSQEVAIDTNVTLTVHATSTGNANSAQLVAGSSVTMSTTLGTFANGQQQQTLVVPAGQTVTFTLSSSTAGQATVSCFNTSADGQIVLGCQMAGTAAGTNASTAAQTVTFYGAPSVSNANTTATIGGNAAKNNTAATAVALGNGAYVLHVEDAGDREVAGAPTVLTLASTGAACVFQASGGTTLNLSTDANGEVSATISCPGSGAAAGSVTANVNASTGAVTIVSYFVRAGVSANVAVAMAGSSPAGGTANGTNATDMITTSNQTDVELFPVTVTDAAGTRVDHPGAKTASCTGNSATTSTQALTSNVTLEDPTAGASTGRYVIEMDIVAGHGGTVTCTWNIAASGSHPAFSGTVEFKVQNGTAATVELALAGGVSQVKPGSATAVTATLFDSNGIKLVTSNADATQFAVNGTTGGNMVVPSGTNVAHTHGTANATFISGDVLGTFTITGVTQTSNRTGFQIVTVTNTPTVPTTPVEGLPFEDEPTFTGGLINVSKIAANTSLADFQAGVATLPAGSRVFVQNASGQIFGYIVGGGVANAGFNAQFAAGLAAGSATFTLLP